MRGARVRIPARTLVRLARHLEVSEQTYHRWRSRFGGMKADDARRLKELERKDAWLKWLVADKEVEFGAVACPRWSRFQLEEDRTVSDLFVDSWGAGTPVVLVHGSLATGAEEWECQRPLVDEGFRLLVLDRRGYGRSPAAAGEDFLRDGDDVAELMGDGAHLVGHSYGGLGVMFAATRHPDATLSLALLEPGTFALGRGDPAARSLVDAVRRMWDQDLPDDEWVVRFLKAVGSDPDEFPPDFLAAAVPLVPVFRRGRPVWDSDLPLAELATARFPKLVVSGGHSAGFDAICDDLAQRIGASRAVVAGAGHEIQFTGQLLNDALLALWRADPSSSASSPSSGRDSG